MSNLPFPKSTSLQTQLDSQRPDMPTCAETKAAQLIDPFLLAKDKSGRTRMEMLLMTWYDYKIANPGEISLLEISKSSSMGQRNESEDTKHGVLDLFAEMDATPVTVVEASEGYGT